VFTDCILAHFSTAVAIFMRTHPSWHTGLSLNAGEARTGPARATTKFLIHFPSLGYL